MTKIKVTDKKAVRIKYLQDDPIPDIDTSWQIDDETSYPGSRVEEFIKSQLRKRIGVVYYDGTTKQYKCFSNIKDRDAYVNDPTSAADKVIASFEAPSVYYDQESKDRLAGDSALQQKIDAEIKARGDKDAVLEKSVSDEVKARTSADTALQQKIDAEVKALGDKDAVLEKSVSDEVKARTSADTALQQAVDAEAASRESADTSLQQALDTETHTRTNENTALLQKINDEIKARGDNDTTLQNSLSAAQKSIDVLNKHMVTMVTLTETEYEALVTAGTVDDNTFYNILED